MEKISRIRKLGLWFIAYGIIMILLAIGYGWGQISFMLQYGRGGTDIPSLLAFVLFPSLCHIIAGTGIIKLKSWAKKMSLVLVPIGLILTFFYGFFGGFALYPHYLAGNTLAISIILYWVFGLKAFTILRDPNAK